jgi:hypothetical protein
VALPESVAFSLVKTEKPYRGAFDRPALKMTFVLTACYFGTFLSVRPLTAEVTLGSERVMIFGMSDKYVYQGSTDDMCVRSRTTWHLDLCGFSRKSRVPGG